MGRGNSLADCAIILYAIRSYSACTFNLVHPPPSRKVGIVGITGAVGEEILGVLKARGFPVDSIHAFASERSAGKIIDTGSYGNVVVEAFSLEAARKMDVVFLAVDGAFAKEWAEKLCADGGPFVIDNSSQFRYDPKVPLVIPEINAGAIKSSRLIANPNCTTAVCLMALYPLFKVPGNRQVFANPLGPLCSLTLVAYPLPRVQAFGLKRMIMSTYQAASGAGAPGMNEVKDGVKAFAAGQEDLTGTNKVFAHPLPFNLIPHIDVFQENGYTKVGSAINGSKPVFSCSIGLLLRFYGTIRYYTRRR